MKQENHIHVLQARMVEVMANIYIAYPSTLGKLYHTL